MSRFDYLAVGHITQDVTPQGKVIGGSVAFAGRAAHALGCRTGVLTSASADVDVTMALPDVDVAVVPAAVTTTFENRYNGGNRRQWLYQRAATLQPQDLPAGWKASRIVHLAPVADEVTPDLVRAFTADIVGMTPQGWMRAWDDEGRVYARRWAEAESLLPLAAAVIVSQEDLVDESALDDFRRWARLVVLTREADGCTVYLGDEARDIAAPRVEPRNPTGAGDIFAAAFLVRLHQTRGNPWEAAAFANAVAARSVAAESIDAKMAAIAAMSWDSH